MDLNIKTRNNEETKFPPPCRKDRMIRAIHRWQVAEHLESIKISQHILPYDELDLYNDYIIKEPDFAFVSTFRATVYSDTFFMIPIHSTIWVHGRKLYDQPETKECRPTQIETRENNKQKENTPEEQEIQEYDHTNI